MIFAEICIKGNNNKIPTTDFPIMLLYVIIQLNSSSNYKFPKNLSTLLCAQLYMYSIPLYTYHFLVTDYFTEGEKRNEPIYHLHPCCEQRDGIDWNRCQAFFIFIILFYIDDGPHDS